jgi:hypothetical protein
MEKKLTNSGPFRESTRKHSIYPLPHLGAIFIKGNTPDSMRLLLGLPMPTHQGEQAGRVSAF